MIADSKIPEMPLKCTAEVFFPCPAHLFAAYRSYIVMDSFPCPAHLFAAYSSKLHCHGRLPMPRPPFCCLQKFYCHGLVPMPHPLFCCLLKDTCIYCCRLIPRAPPTFCCLQYGMRSKPGTQPPVSFCRIGQLIIFRERQYLHVDVKM